MDEFVSNTILNLFKAQWYIQICISILFMFRWFDLKYTCISILIVFILELTIESTIEEAKVGEAIEENIEAPMEVTMNDITPAGTISPIVGGTIEDMQDATVEVTIGTAMEAVEPTMKTSIDSSWKTQ